MDVNDARSLITVLSFIIFISIVVWAYSGRKSKFDDAANLPFSDDEMHEKTLDQQKRSEQIQRGNP